jgi:hypothetical protein
MRWFKKQRPKRNKDYLCIVDKYGTMMILSYSKEHDGFNCYDGPGGNDHEIKVKYWTPLPELPAGLKGVKS